MVRVAGGKFIRERPVIDKITSIIVSKMRWRIVDLNDTFRTVHYLTNQGIEVISSVDGQGS